MIIALTEIVEGHQIGKTFAAPIDETTLPISYNNNIQVKGRYNSCFEETEAIKLLRKISREILTQKYSLTIVKIEIIFIPWAEPLLLSGLFNLLWLEINQSKPLEKEWKCEFRQSIEAEWKDSSKKELRGY